MGEAVRVQHRSADLSDYSVRSPPTFQSGAPSSRTATLSYQKSRERRSHVLNHQNKDSRATPSPCRDVTKRQKKHPSTLVSLTKPPNPVLCKVHACISPLLGLRLVLRKDFQEAIQVFMRYSTIACILALKLRSRAMLETPLRPAGKENRATKPRAAREHTEQRDKTALLSKMLMYRTSVCGQYQGWKTASE